MIKFMVKKEFRQLRRDRRMLPIVFVAPVLQLVLLGYAANLDPQNIPAIICDLDRTPQSRELAREFYASGYFQPSGIIYIESDIIRAMETTGSSAALVIPKGFGRDLEQGRIPQLPYVADGSDSSTASIALGYARNIVLRYGSRYSGQPGKALMEVRTRIFFNPALKSRNFMVPGLLALVLLVMTLILTSLAVVKEKEIGTMEQLIVTPLKTREILLGKLIPFALIGIFDVLLIVAAGRVVFGLEMAGSFLLLFGFSLLFLLNTLGLGLLVSTFSNNQQQAMMASVFFVMLPMVILSGFVFPVENMPLPIRLVSQLMPPKYYFTIVRGIYLKGAGMKELWDEGLALLILGVGIFTVSLVRFRKRLE